MKIIQIVVLLHAVVLIKITSGANSYGVLPNFHLKDPDEFSDSYYGSSEFQTSDFGSLERKDLEDRYTKSWSKQSSKMKITLHEQYADAGYEIKPSVIEIITCVLLKQSELKQKDGDCANHNDVFQKIQKINLQMKRPNSVDMIELLEFNVPDGCDCKSKSHI